MIPKANQLARGSSLGEIDLMLIDAIKANAHGRKVKDIHFDPYSENGVVKVGIFFEEEKTDNVQDYSGLSDLERAIHRGFLCAGVENVPVAIIKETAKECLELAKKELARRDEVITLDNLPPYDKGFQDGKAEALKDLPRWRIWGNGACGNSDNIPIAIVKRGFNYQLVSTLGIQGEHYIMLSDLEKLPGFKEDKLPRFYGD